MIALITIETPLGLRRTWTHQLKDQLELLKFLDDVFKMTIKIHAVTVH